MNPKPEISPEPSNIRFHYIGLFTMGFIEYLKEKNICIGSLDGWSGMVEGIRVKHSVFGPDWLAELANQYYAYYAKNRNQGPWGGLTLEEFLRFSLEGDLK